MVLSLDHGGPLGAQRSHGLEDIDNALILQTLEHDAQSDEHAGASDSGTERGRFDFKNSLVLQKSCWKWNGGMHIPAVDSDWPFLAKLLLRLVHLAHEVRELSAELGHPLLWPVRELELPQRARLAVPGVRHLELAQEVLRHVVLRQGVHYEALVTR